MIEVNAIDVYYGGFQALHSVSFELAPGEILGVIGPNGAGKTTLIRAISGVLPLRSGQVLVNGMDIRRMSANERAKLMAFMPQAVNLPPAFTAWETVLLGRTPHLNWLGQTSPLDEAAARLAMQRTHTHHLAQRRVGELSGGEQQRLLLGRALAQATPILIMDEPTAHLDLQYQLSLLNQVRSLAKQDQLAVLVALHDLNLVARFATRIALLVGGKLQALGNPSQVLTPAILSQAYQVSLQVLPLGSSSVPVITPAIQ